MTLSLNHRWMINADHRLIEFQQAWLKGLDLPDDITIEKDVIRVRPNAAYLLSQNKKYRGRKASLRGIHEPLDDVKEALGFPPNSYSLRHEGHLAYRDTSQVGSSDY